MHDLNIGGSHQIVRSDRKVPSGTRRLGVHVERLVRKEPPAKGSRTGITDYTLLIDGEKAESLQIQLGFHTLISWSGSTSVAIAAAPCRTTMRRSNSPDGSLTSA